MDILDEAAQFLIQRETITGKEFMEIFRKYKDTEDQASSDEQDAPEEEIPSDTESIHTETKESVNPEKPEAASESDSFQTGYAPWVEDDDENEIK